MAPRSGQHRLKQTITVVYLLAPLWFPFIIGVWFFVILSNSGKIWLWDIFYAVAFGLASTLLFALVQKPILRSPQFHMTASNISIMTDTIMWGLTSFILMGFAFNFLNRAVFKEGIFILATSKHRVFGLSILDFLAMGFFVLLCTFRLGYPRWYSPIPNNLGELRDDLNKVRSRAYGLVITVSLFALFAWYVLWKPEFIYQQIRKLFTEFSIDGTRVSYALLQGPSTPRLTLPSLMPDALLSPLPVLLGMLALVSMIVVYFTWRRLWIQLDEKRLLGGVQNKIPAIELLPVLFLGVVVLPPLIVGVSIPSAIDHVTGRLLWGDIIIFGLFLYSGLLVWSTSMQLADKTPSPWLISILVFMFAYALFITILWILVIEFIRKYWLIDPIQANFDALINAAMSAILIILIFSALYRRVLGRSLSDSWPGERLNYMIFSMIVGPIVVSIPNNHVAKPFIILLAIIVLLMTPAILLRRRVSAFVLIITEPGATENVQQQLEEEGIESTSLFGRFGLIARIEVERRRGTEDALLNLSEKIQRQIRSKTGVLSTETLVDISHLTAYWSMIHR